MEKCRRMKRPQFTSKNWIFSWLWMPRKDVSSIVAWKALRWKRIFLWIDQRSKNHISSKMEFGLSANTENFVPIVVPDLSTSSSSSSYPSTAMTSSRQERHCSTSSSSSSSSPTTATSSDNETRERDDQTENDTPPVPVSSFNVDEKNGETPCGPSQPKTSKNK